MTTSIVLFETKQLKYVWARISDTQMLGGGSSEAAHDVQSLLKTLQKCLAFENEAKARFAAIVNPDDPDNPESTGTVRSIMRFFVVMCCECTHTALYTWM